ncbi:MAG: hypothetical protein HC876_10880 [Chloroflexaceae bacterium]|nr:hypothetical protein [Chloroflexaceae bacterium]
MKRPLIVIAGVLVLVIVGGVGWYLGSPLFLNQQVNEDLPFAFEAPGAEELSAMSEAEVEQVRGALQAAIPNEATLAEMPEAEQQAIEDAAMEAAAVMPDKTMEDPMPEAATEPMIVLQGQFQDADAFHQGSGLAKLFELPDGSRLLRFEDFQVTNGPALHVLLATNPNPTSSDDLGEYIDLGQLKGNVGSQNYEIGADVDLSQYNSIVIYCKPFHIVFSIAPLS